MRTDMDYEAFLLTSLFARRDQSTVGAPHSTATTYSALQFQYLLTGVAYFARLPTAGDDDVTRSKRFTVDGVFDGRDKHAEAHGEFLGHDHPRQPNYLRQRKTKRTEKPYLGHTALGNRSLCVAP